MKRAVMETGFRRVRDARLALGALLVLSMTANLALGIGLAGREAVTVLVPAITGPAWEVGGGRAGARYLEDMARTAAVTLLTLTPENAAHVRRAAARMSHPSARGAIGAWVESQAARMAGRDLATAFYPDSIEADTGRLTVEIAGELVTWIGREESARHDRRYRLAFRIDGGRIGLCASKRWRTDPMTGKRATVLAAAGMLAAHLIYVGAAAPALAMQILEAADHAELAAEVSATGVNRIALSHDRIRRVIRSPGGFEAEHDPETGDLYLRPMAAGHGSEPEAADPPAPVILFLGTEKGFTYRLTLTPRPRFGPDPDPQRCGCYPGCGSGCRDCRGRSAHNGAGRADPRGGAARAAGGIRDRDRTGMAVGGLPVIETWRGPRFAAHVVESDGVAIDAADLAGTMGIRAAAAWLAAPGTGPSGGRLAVIVTDAAGPNDAIRP